METDEHNLSWTSMTDFHAICLVPVTLSRVSRTNVDELLAGVATEIACKVDGPLTELVAKAIDEEEIINARVIVKARKYTIMKDMLKKSEQYKSYESTRFKATSTNLDGVNPNSIVNGYTKGKKKLIISEFDTDSRHNKISYFEEGDKCIFFFETPTAKTMQIKERNESPEMQSNFSFEEFKNDREILLKAIRSQITKEKYNQKECYVIKDNEREIYLDKSTGLIVKDIQKDNIQEFEREFNINIDDSVFEKPNMEEYQLVN